MLGLRAVQSGSARHADSMRGRTEHQWIHLVATEDILNYFKPGFQKFENKSRMTIYVMHANWLRACRMYYLLMSFQLFPLRLLSLKLLLSLELLLPLELLLSLKFLLSLKVLLSLDILQGT